ncbi:Fn3 like domain-containing protein [Citrus sinensis]|nr:Fn3 like domain-containing protein [Citrus sinensis]
MHQAIEVAKNAEATIIFAGLDLTIEAESLDRENPTLPADAAKGPVTIVIMSAGGVDISFAKRERLPVTWYKADYVNKLPMSSMPLRPADSKGYPGRTYKFFDGLNFDIKLDKRQHCRDIKYTIGASSSKCSAVLTDDLKCNDAFEFKMAVQNAGKVDGSEAVIVYSKPPERIATTHINQVIGFQRVFVAAGEYEKIKFTFNFCKSLIIVD